MKVTLKRLPDDINDARPATVDVSVFLEEMGVKFIAFPVFQTCFPELFENLSMIDSVAKMREMFQLNGIFFYSTTTDVHPDFSDAMKNDSTLQLMLIEAAMSDLPVIVVEMIDLEEGQTHA